MTSDLTSALEVSHIIALYKSTYTLYFTLLQVFPTFLSDLCP